jgi:hypothetical protein
MGTEKQKNENSTAKVVKVQVFVPEEFEEIMRKAIADAGGGKIGNYDNCFFVSKGISYFRPLEGSNPTIGDIGKIEQIEEMKIEFICNKNVLDKVVEAIKGNHPYEEVPIDIIPLMNFNNETIEQ